MYGLLPLNIKTTTTLTSDNTGNLAMCLTAYTDEILDFNVKYSNGVSSKMLSTKIRNKELNKTLKKDYYFIIINKLNTKDIIVNSCRGLTVLTPNINNLPFQVCWNKNRTFVFRNINMVINDFIISIKKPKPSWRESFLLNIRSIDI